MLLTEIGFLCQSRVLESELQAKLEGLIATHRLHALALFVVLVDSTFGWLDYETTVWLCFTYLRAGSPRQRASC